MDQTSYENFRADLYKAIWRDLDPLEQEIEESYICGRIHRVDGGRS